MKRILRKLYRNIPLSLYQFVFNYLDKERVLFYALQFAASGDKQIGDYLEFGVAGGNSFVSAYHLIKKTKKLSSMRAIAFDSFKGLPEPKGVDAQVKDFKKGEWFVPLETFKNNLIKNYVDLNRGVIIVPGWFKDTLKNETKINFDIRGGAVIMIDSDLYESAVLALDFVTDLLFDGSIILFDEWFAFRGRKDCGEQLAFKEWLRKNPQYEATEFYRFGSEGNSFTITTKK